MSVTTGEKSTYLVLDEELDTLDRGGGGLGDCRSNEIGFKVLVCITQVVTTPQEMDGGLRSLCHVQNTGQRREQNTDQLLHASLRTRSGDTAHDEILLHVTNKQVMRWSVKMVAV